VPRMPAFDWIQLERDRWSIERINGEQFHVVERRLAFFPQRPGTLTIEPAVQNLEIIDDRNRRSTHKVTSQPVRLAVLPPTKKSEGSRGCRHLDWPSATSGASHLVSCAMVRPYNELSP
jgi:hypothetical protein